MGRAYCDDVTFGQNIWWRNAEGIQFLIDSMDDRYRHNVANWLLDRAAKFAERKWRMEWFVALASPYAPDDLPDETYSIEAEDNMIYRRLDKGEHLDWIRSTPLYQRMAA